MGTWRFVGITFLAPALLARVGGAVSLLGRCNYTSRIYKNTSCVRDENAERADIEQNALTPGKWPGVDLSEEPL